MAVNPRRVTWLKVNKKASGNRRSQRKRRSKLLLQRRVKRARRRVGSRRSDQARRNRNKRLAFDGGPFSFYAGRSIATRLYRSQSPSRCCVGYFTSDSPRFRLSCLAFPATCPTTSGQTPVRSWLASLRRAGGVASPVSHTKRKSRPKRLFNSNLMIADQAAINAGFDFRR